MIATLRLDNYRSFEEYRLSELSSVNLLVGPNNCGKTSVLEAVELLASRGDPLVLTKSARRRWESSSAEDRPRSIGYPLHHHFHGHRLEPGVRLGVSSGHGLGRVRMYIVEREPEDLFGTLSRTVRPLALLIQAGIEEDGTQFPLAEDGSLDWHPVAMRRAAAKRPKSPPIQFVTADSLHAREMGGIWNQVIQQGRESEVVEALSILQKDLQSIHFLAGEPTRSARGSGGILLGFQPGTPRVPIGSLGDGMRRLLALSLSLVRAAEGFLLIDEIDTGFHWTVMEDMWNLVVDAAVTSSIQVFATTHSLDCIIGLAALLRNRPDLAKAVSVQKIERQLDHSVSFGATDIITSADLSIELR